MINIEQITSRLAKLPDQQLQQYAMMHKSDPYIMALAVSESNRRKQLRASAQAGPAQEQPKVADMALAEMAPAEAGIAALPTGEMNFADGGIVAFADGGGTYETPYDRMNRLNREAAAAPAPILDPIAQKYQLEAEEMGMGTRMQFSPDVKMYAAQLRAAEQAPQQAYAERERALMLGKPVVAQAPAAGPAAAPISRPTERMTPQQMEAKVASAPVAAAPKAKPKAEAGLAGTPEAAAVRGAPGVGAPSVAGAKELAGQFLDTKTLRGDLEKFYKDEEAAVEAARKRRDEGKPEGKAYSEYEKQLQAEAAGADKEKGEAQGVAIFKAGLAMMAGASPNAFENIGKGAMVGLEEYSGAMKDMKKAAKERQKAMADIENARRAESRDDWKAAREFEDKADARLSKAREFGVKGIMDLTGKDAEIAAGIYKTQVTEQGATQRTGMQVAAMRDRAVGKLELTPNQRAEIANKAMDNINATLKANVSMQIRAAKDPAYMQQLIQAETDRLMAAAEGRTMAAAPGAASPGGTTRMRFDAQGNPIK